jgi:hypothetical protein
MAGKDRLMMTAEQKMTRALAILCAVPLLNVVVGILAAVL